MNKVVRKLCALACTGLLATCVLAVLGCTPEKATEGDGTYVIATDTVFAPFEYLDANGAPAGIDIDIMNAIAADQGLRIEIAPLGFDAAMQAVQSGQAQGVIAGVSITPKRQESFDFSEPYFDSTVCCAVAADSPVKALADLAGKTVAVKLGTLGADWAADIAERHGFAISTFESSDAMYQGVYDGTCAACFEDTPVMGFGIMNGSINMSIIAEAPADSDWATPYGFAVKKGSDASLLEAFNAGLANLRASGAYDKIIATYLAK